MDTGITVTQSLLCPLISDLGISLIKILIQNVTETGLGECRIEYGQVGILPDKTGKELVG